MKLQYIDDRADFFGLLAQKLGPGFEFIPGDAAPELARQCDAVIVGLAAPADPQHSEQAHMLRHLVSRRGGPPVIAMLGGPDRQLMRAAIAFGAYDYVFENAPLDELTLVLSRAARFHELNREVDRLRSAVPIAAMEEIIGSDQKLRSLFAKARRAAPTTATVLLTGESGTGKELLARAIHRLSANAAGPFVAVACSSLPESLIEAELFGHEKGAFTGAAYQRKGRFEAAENGTLFLDEIGELSPGLQVKLLRVLQERTFERLGSNVSRPLVARVVCATNRNLTELIKLGRFRLDLYYRLNTIEIHLPPLRDRRDDIVLLAHSFLRLYAERHNRPATRISRAAIACLQEYDWPGNVRELQNVIERAVILCENPEIGIDDLPPQLADEFALVEAASFDDEVRAFKRRLIQRALVQFANNKLQAARSLKIARSSLHRLIDELRVVVPAEILSDESPETKQVEKVVDIDTWAA